MTKHNKKRNVGIIYELLLRQISNDLIENNISRVKKTTKIIENHFHKNSDLYKEFRLVNALAKSDVKNTEIAAAILTEARGASRRLDDKKIYSAKSRLIKDINHQINDNMFYHRKVSNYVDYANIHTLIKEWRKGDNSNLKNVVRLERKIIDILLEETSVKDIYHEKNNINASQSNNLVVKLMTEKINNKYASMSEDQKEIIKNYALFNNSQEQGKLISFLKERKEKCLSAINKFEKENNNIFIGKKIAAVKEKIEKLNENDMSDNSIVKFMTITNLIKEIKGE
jgi:hypothetical protein